MFSSADENIHGLAVEIPTNHREIPGSTPGRYNLQIEIASPLAFFVTITFCWRRPSAASQALHPCAK